MSTDGYNGAHGERFSGTHEVGRGEQMIQSWAVEKMADAHRHDLMASADAHRAASGTSRRHAAEAPSVMASRHSITGLPVSGDRVARRPMGQRVGHWLIQAGTRLGGASISPS